MGKPDGGPAFPRPMGHNGMEHHEEHDWSTDDKGMSLRDWFAGQALAGGALEFFQGNGGGAWKDYNEFAASCYGMADAMLAEREK